MATKLPLVDRTTLQLNVMIKKSWLDVINSADLSTFAEPVSIFTFEKALFTKNPIEFEPEVRYCCLTPHFLVIDLYYLALTQFVDMTL